MSLINKMLQDLDARGSQSGASLQAEIKPVMAPESRLPVRQIAVGATLLVLALAAGGWWWLKKSTAPVAAQAPQTAQTPSTPPAFPVAAAVPAAPAQAVARAPLVPPQEAEAGPQTLPSATQDNRAPERAPAPRLAGSPKVARPAPTPPVPQALRAASPAPVLPAVAAGGRNMNDAQRSERLYSDAIAMLDNGRVSAAMETLGQTLALNPRHEGARQTLAGLLIEAGRKDEALQQLEEGLAADPAQPQMAMLLARMQIERGLSGVPVLMRTLPAAADNADYHAFLAGALQRDGRHREAVDQYVLALRANPEQGVWLMGMGISLQAEQRNAEARSAFERASASGMLSAPLQEFVGRKLQQLGR
jgi:MSHA biogenesis protein MshN